VEAVYADESIWLTQKMMGVLYDVETQTINYHLKKVFGDSELEASSVIRKFRITAADGKSYDTQHYSLAAIIAVGYKVNSERAVQFRKWATGTFGYRQWHSFYAEQPPIGQQPVGHFGQQAVAQILSIHCGHTTSTTTGSATARHVNAFREMWEVPGEAENEEASV
jgi:hypothetical protein